MKKNWIKIVLDIVMAIGLFTLFSVPAVGLTFHEVFGLVLFGMFMIHLLLNTKWIISFTRKFFSKQVPFKVRLAYVLDVFLLISFLIIILSGITMSKAVFPDLFEEVETFKTAHYFFSALALVLVGIHTGLHWAFIKIMFGRIFKLPPLFVKPVSAVMLVGVFVIGGYGLVNSEFVAWLASPMIPLVEGVSGWPEGYEGRGGGKGLGRNSTGETIEHDETEEGIRGYRGGLGASFDIGKTLEVVAQFGSIMVLIAVVTAGCETLILRKKKKALISVA
jgi:hypothetical protein